MASMRAIAFFCTNLKYEQERLLEKVKNPVQLKCPVTDDH
jgi:hypothetical protein